MFGTFMPALSKVGRGMLDVLAFQLAFLMNAPDAFVSSTVPVIHVLTGPYVVKYLQEHIVSMAKQVCRMSPENLAAMVTELLDSHLVATLLFAIIIFRRERDRIVRQVKILASKAVSQSLGCFADFPNNFSSLLRQLRGQKSFLLSTVTVIPFAIHAGAAPVFMRILCTTPSCSVSQLEQHTSNNLDTAAGSKSLGPGEVAIIAVATVAVLLIVASTIWKPRFPFRRGHHRRYWPISSAVTFVNEDDLVSSRDPLRNVLAGTQAIGILFPPRAVIGYSWRTGARSIFELPHIALSETAVDSNSSLSLQGRSSSLSNSSSIRLGSISDSSLQSLFPQHDPEDDLQQVGAVFADTPVDLGLGQNNVDFSVSESEDFETLTEPPDAEYVDHQAASPASSDIPDQDNHSSSSQPVNDLNVQEIYDLVAQYTRTDDTMELFIPPAVGLASLSGSTAAGTCELGEAGSNAGLHPDETWTREIIDAPHVEDEMRLDLDDMVPPGIRVAWPLLIQDAMLDADDSDDASAASGAPDATLARGSPGHGPISLENEHDASLAKPSNI